MDEGKEAMNQSSLSEESGYLSTATDTSTPARNVEAARPATPHVGGRGRNEADDLDIDQDLASLPSEQNLGDYVELKKIVLENSEKIARNRQNILELADAVGQVPEQVHARVMETHQGGPITLDEVTRIVEEAIKPLSQRMEQLSLGCAQASRQTGADVKELRGGQCLLRAEIKATNTNVKATRLSMNNVNQQTQTLLDMLNQKAARTDKQSRQALALGARAVGQADNAAQGVGEIRRELDANEERLGRVEGELQETKELLHTTNITVNHLVQDNNQQRIPGGLLQARDDDRDPLPLDEGAQGPVVDAAAPPGPDNVRDRGANGINRHVP